jgi:hypothetical protein
MQEERLKDRKKGGRESGGWGRGKKNGTKFHKRKTCYVICTKKKFPEKMILKCAKCV